MDCSPLSASSKAVAIEILVHGAQSRTRLANRMGLSAATLTRLVRPLLEAGVLVESDAVRTPGRGRSSLPLDVVPDRYRFIGVKLTTESIYAVVTDLRAKILEREVVAIRSLRVPDVVAAVSAIVDVFQSHSDLPVDAVGVTVGGQVEAGEIVADSPFLNWHAVPFRALLREELGTPVHLDNDVVGLTQAQHWFGYGKGYENFALLTVGAGIGYGLVVNNTVVPTLVSPISHYPVDPAGPLCPLGHRGCMTAYLASDSIISAVSVGHGRLIGYDEVLEMAKADDPIASRVVSEAARALGRTASAISSLTGVELIILSGEGVHLAEVAQSSVEQGLIEYDVPRGPNSECVVRPMTFFEWARGAAAIAIQAEFPG
ncbi:MAG: ROK family transcriptional regulator [Nocardioidaceae bacterium]|nr:ROK family transcriptional regulator [Nocardioidaceae bacterium]